MGVTTRICKVAGLFLFICVASTVTAERNYVFTAPKVLRAGDSSQMCLTLMSTIEPAQITVNVSDTSQLLGQHKQMLSPVPDGEYRINCFKVFLNETNNFSGEISVEVQFLESANHTIKLKQKVSLRLADSENTLVQTDKPLYKPGQTVYIRILTIDSHLQPVDEPIRLVYVRSSSGARLAQWSNVRSQSGLAQLDFQLSEQAGLGEWDIHIESGSGAKTVKTFKVDEFVLPKFSVQIISPAYILSSDKEVTWKVCAKYTHGNPVSGMVELTAHPDYYKPPSTKKTATTADDGCATFTFNDSELFLGKNRQPVFGLELDAIFTESGTDTVERAQASETVNSVPLFLTSEKQDNKFFKPGLPYQDKILVTKPDKSPVAGELIELCYQTTANRTKSRTRYYETFENEEEQLEYICRNLTSNSDGAVDILLLELNTSVDAIHIRARAVNHPTILSESKRWGYWPEFMRMPSLVFEIGAWYSPSGSFIQLPRTLDESQGVLRCDDNITVTALFTAPLGQHTIFYQVISDGDLQLSAAVDVDFSDSETVNVDEMSDHIISSSSSSSDTKPIGRVTLPLPASLRRQLMSQQLKLLVYMVVSGEIVADSRHYSLQQQQQQEGEQDCAANSAHLTWSQSRVRPGQSVDLQVTAEPNSLCGIDVVDKSVHLMGTSNRILPSALTAITHRLGIQPWEGETLANDDLYCTAKHGPPKLEELEIEIDDDANSTTVRDSFHHPTEHLIWTSTYRDSSSAFDDATSTVTSDLIVQSRPCLQDIRVMYLNYMNSVVDDAGGPQESIALELVKTVRKYFPETWLFQLIPVGATGSAVLKQTVPDTITEWVGGAVCSSKLGGGGASVSSIAALTTYQEVFVSLKLPYAVKRKEIVHVKASVFNYLNRTMPISVTLSETSQYKIQSEHSFNLCLAASSSQVVSFQLEPLELGKVNLTVTAQVLPQFDRATLDCDVEQPLSDLFSDTVIRPLLVKPEGFRKEVTQTKFICIEDESNELTSNTDLPEQTWLLSVPDDLVANSTYAEVKVAGDLLGPSFENIGSLVSLPSGCGEQNMIRFVPNIVVMRYLISFDELTEPLKEKLISYMNTGYTRELNYRHSDGSYSAFGSEDESGSTWLTAFVVASFSQASRFIEIDQEDIVQSVNWLQQHQSDDTGCFQSVGKVLHKALKGGVASAGEHALSAYVTASLLHTKVQLRDNVIKNAFRCLEKSESASVYTVTLRAYAYALAGRWSQALGDYQLLMQMANASDGLLWWEPAALEHNDALKVETSAYVVLIGHLLKNSGHSDTDSIDFFSHQLSICRFISKQMNGKGGFYSTQDTVLALAALATFAGDLPHNKDSQLQLQIGYRPQQQQRPQLLDTLQVTSENRLLTQRLQLPTEQLPLELSFRVSGSGCALVQSWLVYNVHTALPSDALAINITATPLPSATECAKHTLNICVKYMGEGASNMALVEVEMVSGFVADESSLTSLLHHNDLGFKRSEFKDDMLVLYFDEITKRPMCFDVIVERKELVEMVKPALARVRDYYQPEFALSTTYTLDTECRPEVPTENDVGKKMIKLIQAISDAI